MSDSQQRQDISYARINGGFTVIRVAGAVAFAIIMSLGAWTLLKVVDSSERMQRTEYRLDRIERVLERLDRHLQ